MRRPLFSIFATHWHMDFICGDDAEVGILDFPPPLVADEADFQRALRHGLVLNLHDRAGGNEDKDENDQAGNDRPGHFDIVAAVNLRRLFEMVFRSARSEFDEDVDQHGNNDEKNAKADEEDKVCRLEEQLSWSRERLKYVSDSMNLRNRATLWFCSGGCGARNIKKKRSCRKRDEIFSETRNVGPNRRHVSNPNWENSVWEVFFYKITDIISCENWKGASPVF